MQELDALLILAIFGLFTSFTDISALFDNNTTQM